jgi:hypothetical protein
MATGLRTVVVLAGGSAATQGSDRSLMVGPQASHHQPRPRALISPLPKPIVNVRSRGTCCAPTATSSNRRSGKDTPTERRSAGDPAHFRRRLERMWLLSHWRHSGAAWGLPVPPDRLPSGGCGRAAGPHASSVSRRARTGGQVMIARRSGARQSRVAQRLDLRAAAGRRPGVVEGFLPRRSAPRTASHCDPGSRTRAAAQPLDASKLLCSS